MVNTLSSCFQQTSISSFSPSDTVIQREVVAGALHPATTQKEWLAIGSSVMAAFYVTELAIRGESPNCPCPLVTEGEVHLSRSSASWLKSSVSHDRQPSRCGGNRVCD